MFLLMRNKAENAKKENRIKTERDQRKRRKKDKEKEERKRRKKDA